MFGRIVDGVFEGLPDRFAYERRLNPDFDETKREPWRVPNGPRMFSEEELEKLRAQYESPEAPPGFLPASEVEALRGRIDVMESCMDLLLGGQESATTVKSMAAAAKSARSVIDTGSLESLGLQS